MENDHGLLDAFRTNPRTRHPASIVRHDGSIDDVTITEFTTTGFRLVVSLRPKLGELILLRVAGLRDLPGRIRWAHGAEAGGSR
jgi:hypothetical protein